MAKGKKRRSDRAVDDEASAVGLRAQREAVSQGMARLNVRVGAGREPTAVGVRERRNRPGLVVLLIVVTGLVLASLLAIWMLSA